VTAFAAPIYDPRFSPEWGLHPEEEMIGALAKAAGRLGHKRASRSVGFFDFSNGILSMKSTFF
jgi:hypothetical protein